MLGLATRCATITPIRRRNRPAPIILGRGEKSGLARSSISERNNSQGEKEYLRALFVESGTPGDATKKIFESSWALRATVRFCQG